MPVLEAMLGQFPFPIRGFHSPNGSEKLLNKLLVEQTKSRPRHSNDNGLAESENGWVISKHIGYGHIGPAHAEAFDEFYREHFNPYLNFHRPGGVPEVIVMAKGKQKRVYRWYATPFETLRQLPGLAGFLRPDLTADQLGQSASNKSDSQAAAETQQAKRKLFAGLHHLHKTGDGYGDEGVWKARKTKIGFPSLSTALGNRRAIPQSHSPDEARTSGKRKARFPLSRFLFYSTENQ